MTRDRSPSERPVLLSIHGIRTTGKWQKDLTEVAEEAGFRYRPLDYGYFFALSLLLPWKRRSKVQWFKTECERKVGSHAANQRPSIVGHSFGTYLIARALEQYSDLSFDRVILCGSIVRTDFPWGTIIAERNQVSAVLNEAAGRDVWASLASWVISDAGPSGVSGFDRDVPGRLTQRRHALHGHSDHLYTANFRKTWIPFLKGRAVSVVQPIPPARTNWRFTAFLAALIAAITLGVGLYLENDSRSSEPNQAKATQPAAKTVVSGGSPAVTAGSVGPPAEEKKTLEKTAESGGSPVGTAGSVAPPAEQKKKLEKTVATGGSPAANTGSVGPPAEQKTTVDVRGLVWEPNAAVLPAGGFQVLDLLVDTLNRYPEVYITVVGYTDSTEQNAKALSMRRAEIVSRYLVDHGVDEKRIDVDGLGANCPIDTNDTEEGRARNRRTEAQVRQGDSSGTPPPREPFSTQDPCH